MIEDFPTISIGAADRLRQYGYSTFPASDPVSVRSRPAEWRPERLLAAGQRKRMPGIARESFAERLRKSNSLAGREHDGFWSAALFRDQRQVG